MAVYQAFFDAAGDPHDPNIRVFYMAGYIAPEKRWQRLENEWRRVCDRENVSGLHMKDFAHSTGEYREWKGDEARRQRFLSDLIRIIHRHTNRYFNQGVFLDGYRAVDAQFEFHERVGHVYCICAIRCMSQVREWMAKTHPDDDVMFIFEKGDAHQDDVLQFLKRDKTDLGIDPMFIEKHWVNGKGSRGTLPQLECADFLAYESHKTVIDAYTKSKIKARTSAWALTGKGHHPPARAGNIFDGLFFESVAKAFNIPRRSGVPEAPIPKEATTMKDILKENFHGEPRQSLNIVSMQSPLQPLYDRSSRQPKKKG